MVVTVKWLLPMNFSNRLSDVRKLKKLTQQGLADKAGLHINQIRRYESGAAQPTLEGLVKLATSLHITLDDLVFNQDHRGPKDSDMNLLFEAVEKLGDKEQSIIRELLEGMIVKYETRRWDSSR